MTGHLPILSYDLDDDTTTTLDCVGGLPVGVGPEQWPEGRPMPHLMTLDLPGLDKYLARAKEYRALVVFVRSYWDNDADEPGSKDVALRWIPWSAG